MKVLVLGASGTIGLPVAQAILRAGHNVYGLVRSKEAAKKLAAEEITPIIGDATSPDSWISIIKSVDAVIDTVGGSADIKTVSDILLEAICKAAKSFRPQHSPKLTYVYTSGIWVHGDDRMTIVTDTSPITNPCKLVEWRPAQEEKVISNEQVNGVVIRPGAVYGRSFFVFSFLFKGAAEPKVVRYPGSSGGKLTIVHQDDLADLYLRVVENGVKVKGLIFDAANDVTECTSAFSFKLMQISGADKWEFKEPENPFEEALSSTALVRPYLGRSLLGWRPMKPGLTDNLSVYYEAWKASQN